MMALLINFKIIKMDRKLLWDLSYFYPQRHELPFLYNKILPTRGKCCFYSRNTFHNACWKKTCLKRIFHPVPCNSIVEGFITKQTERTYTEKQLKSESLYGLKRNFNLACIILKYSCHKSNEIFPFQTNFLYKQVKFT